MKPLVLIETNKATRDDRARLAAAFAAHLRPAEAKKAVVALFKVAPSTARHLISRGRFLGEQGEIAR